MGCRVRRLRLEFQESPAAGGRRTAAAGVRRSRHHSQGGRRTAAAGGHRSLRARCRRSVLQGFEGGLGCRG